MTVGKIPSLFGQLLAVVAPEPADMNGTGKDWRERRDSNPVRLRDRQGSFATD